MTPPPRREPSRTKRAQAERAAAGQDLPTPPWRHDAAAGDERAARAGGTAASTSGAAPSVLALRRLLRFRKLLILSLVLAILVGVFAGNSLSLSPLKLEPRGTSYGYANSKLLIDSDRTRVGDVSKQLGALGDRAEVFTSLMTSDPVRSAIAARLGVATSDISSRVVESGVAIGDNSDAEGQLDAIRRSSADYQLTFEAERSGPNGSVSLPLIDVTGQAPDALKARQLVDAAGLVASTYFTDRASRRGVQRQNAARATPVGRAEGVLVLGGASKAISLLIGIVTFAVLCGLILTYQRFAQDWQAAGEQTQTAKAREKRRRSGRGDDAPGPGPGQGDGDGETEQPRTRTASSA